MLTNIFQQFKKGVVNFVRYYQLPILSGVLIGTSYIPLPPWALLFGFTPLWLFFLQEKSWKRVFIGGWITQFILTIIGFNWVAHTIHEFGFLPWVVAITGLFLFGCFANLYVPLGLLLAQIVLRSLVRKSHYPTLWVPLLILAFSTAITMRWCQTIFEWNFGYPWLWAGLPIFQLADIFGFLGISTMILIINAMLTYCWTLHGSRKGRWVLTAALSFFLALNGWGYLKAKTLPKEDSEASVLIVQANIGNLQKHYAERGWGFRDYILGQYTKLTRQALNEAGPDQKIDFALWPETAFPTLLGRGLDYNKHASQLKAFLKRTQLNLVTGAYSETPKNNKTTNSMFFLNDNGEYITTPYFKTTLLAFGEYMPMGETFPILKKWLPAVSDFGRGDGPKVKKFNDMILGPQICYEGLYPQFSVDLANLGANIFVNVTNDSWFGTWAEPFQHLYMTLGRAIELRRPLIRSTNTGVSTVITASGKIMETSPLHQQWFHLYKIPYSKVPSETFFQKFPWLMWVLEIALLLLVALIAKGRFWKQKQEKTAP